MYNETKTWNPFKGCLFDCVYCKPSFQAQAKRQKWRCTNCYNFVPHTHPERLNKIPSAKQIFVAGNGDISFCPVEFIEQIINSIKGHKKKKTFYLQSKQPKCFNPFIDMLPENVILLTTLETNRDKDYEKISKAPKPSQRFEQFLNINYPRKVVTIEPLLDFDLEIFLDMILQIDPEYVWIGLNTRPKQVQLPEPSKEKFDALYEKLQNNNIEIRHQTIREDYCDS